MYCVPAGTANTLTAYIFGPLILNFVRPTGNLNDARPPLGPRTQPTGLFRLTPICGGALPLTPRLSGTVRLANGHQLGSWGRLLTPEVSRTAGAQPGAGAETPRQDFPGRCADSAVTMTHRLPQRHRTDGVARTGRHRGDQPPSPREQRRPTGPRMWPQRSRSRRRPQTRSSSTEGP